MCAILLPLELDAKKLLHLSIRELIAHLVLLLRTRDFPQPRERSSLKPDSLSMSYAQSNNNGLLNSGYTRGQIDRYDEDSEDGGPAGASQVHRAGGYGGFLNDSLPLPLEYESAVPPRHRPPDADWENHQAHENSYRGARSYMASNRSRSQDRAGRGSSNARAYGSGPGGRQIEG